MMDELIDCALAPPVLRNEEGIVVGGGGWYSRLRAAIDDPGETSMDELLRLLRSSGVFRLRSVELSDAASTVLEERRPALPNGVRWLMRRLRNAGLPPPYADYIALEALFEHPGNNFGSSEVARKCIRLIHDLFHFLSQLPELEDHPRRKVLEKYVEDLLGPSRDYSFSRILASVPRYVVKISLVPESCIRDELIFLRVVQGTELVLSTVAVLATQATELTAHNDALETVGALHWVVRLQTLLLPLLKLLAPMTVESWEEIRPFIVEPSAIQSIAFHSLQARFDELNRILGHPRFPEWQQSYLPACQSLLREALAQLHTWYRAHGQIAAKYARAHSGPASEGVEWLRKQSSLAEGRHGG